jgi:hypothetical protein
MNYEKWSTLNTDSSGCVSLNSTGVGIRDNTAFIPIIRVVRLLPLALDYPKSV